MNDNIRVEGDTILVSVAHYSKQQFVDFIKQANLIEVNCEPDIYEPVTEWAKTHFKVGSSGAYGIERMWQSYEPMFSVGRYRFTFGQFVAYREFLNQIDLDAAPIVGEVIWHGFYKMCERVDEKFIEQWQRVKATR